MTVADADLVAAIESTLHIYPPVPGLVDALGVPGLQGRVTKVSHPLANLVGMARLDDRSADAAIARVKKVYADRRLAFGWVVGPNTTPHDLRQRLTAADIKKEGESVHGMALTDLDIETRPTTDADIREVHPTDALGCTEMMGRAYGMPTAVAAFFAKLLAADTGIQTRSYFAYVGDKPVAWSYLVYVSSSPIVLLGGAGTLPEQRGRGIYSALVKRRLDDARADGREAAIIQAGHMSAPICKTLGFRDLCTLDFHVWSPPS